ncbi:MAG TPA: serine/threonine-protein kinase [Gemmatimonadaceae bacterium]
MDESGAFDAKLRDAFEPAYILERELTGGGMSRVFLARERSLNRQVVIKVLPPELAAGVNRERFRQEIQLAAQLQHPHIVPLYAAGEYGDLLYYTMPFIEGESLKHAIHEHGATKKPFTVREIVRILHDVSDALAYAHARGVIHRDIKPGNVLRSGSHAVVTDFGVAKAISASMPSAGMTTSGMAIGTPAYMAPEQLAGDPAADHRVDIYAMGLLAYELLTGEGPFNETSPQATLAAQMTRNPQPVGRKRPDAPPALAALVMKCLAKTPEQRPQHASELVAAFDAMSLGSGAFVPAAPARRWVVVLATVAVIVVAIVLWNRGHPGKSASTDAAARRSPRETAAPPAATVALTHADSLAIARAIENRMADRSAATPATVKLDSATLALIRADVEKAVLDSFQRPAAGGPAPAPPGARSAPQFEGRRGADFSRMTRAHIDSIFVRNMGPPRRVVVADPRPNPLHPEVQAAGVQLMDALRRRLSAVPRLALANHDSTQTVLQRTRNPNAVMRALKADLAAAISGQPAGVDSVRWIVSLFDANSQVRAQSDTLGPLPLNSTPAVADSLARLMMRDLFQIERSPRRASVTPPSTAPPTPPAPLAQPAPQAPAVKKP